MSLYCKTLPTMRKAWDPTALDAYGRCYTYGNWNLDVGWHNDRVALWWGTLTHGLLEYFDAEWLKKTPKDDIIEAMIRKAMKETVVRRRGKWEPDPISLLDTARGRRQVIRLIVWYVDAFYDNNSLEPYVFPDGTPAIELPYSLPLPIVSPDGDPYILCGRLDGICIKKMPYVQPELWVRERKSTKKTIGMHLFRGYDPSTQMDTYDLVSSILFPDLKIKGVMIEGLQTGVTMARFGTYTVVRNDAQRQEHLNDICNTIMEVEIAARRVYHEGGDWGRRKSSCALYGGCPYARYCRMMPSERDVWMKGQLTKAGTWDPTAHADELRS